MIAIFLLIATAVLGLLHFTVFKSIVSAFSIQNPKTINWLITAFIILGLSFVAASFAGNFFDNVFTRAFYTFASVWLGLIVLMFFAAIIYGLVIVIGKLISPDFQAQWFGILLLGLSVIMGFYGIVHANKIFVREENVTIPGLPSTWQGTKAVIISDVHLGQVRGEEFSQKIVSKIAELNPDIIFIPGDLYDGPKIDEVNAISPFRDLHPKRGIFFSTGNHEEFGSSAHFLDAIRQAGIKVLDNKKELVDGVQIIGVNDKDSNKASRYTEVIENLKIGEQPSIILKHQPTLLDLTDKAGIDLQLSGHTHRGQFFPFSFITKQIFRGFDFGFQKFGNLEVLTSSGIGTWGPPMRIGTDSEIVVLNFK